MISEYADVLPMFGELGGMRQGSPEHLALRETIIERCMPLADHIARRFAGRGETHDDLVQTARIGLLNAVNRFDVTAGSEFESFAVPTIMGEVRRHFRDTSWSVKVPRRLKERHLQLSSATAELSQRMGRAPTASELAEELGMERDQVIEGLIAGNSYNALSIDASSSGPDAEVPAIVDSLGELDSEMEQIENRETLRPLLAGLPERERTVLLLRFFESQTQTQIAERIGVSQMHVSRLLAKALGKLRDELQRPEEPH